MSIYFWLSPNSSILVNSPLILGKFLLLESSNCFLRTLFLVLAQIESLNTSWFIDWCPLNVGKITWFWFNHVNPPFTAESFYLGLGFHQFDCQYYFKFLLAGGKPASNFFIFLCPWKGKQLRPGNPCVISVFPVFQAQHMYININITIFQHWEHMRGWGGHVYVGFMLRWNGTINIISSSTHPHTSTLTYASTSPHSNMRTYGGGWGGVGGGMFTLGSCCVGTAPSTYQRVSAESSWHVVWRMWLQGLTFSRMEQRPTQV